MGYTPGGGGGSWGAPDFSDANPPDPIRQGDMGPEGMGSNRVDENTFESGRPPEARMPISDGSEALIDDDGLSGASMDADRVADKWPGEGIRGFRTSPVGGTYNPGQGTAGRSYKAASTSGGTETSPMA